MAAKGSEKVKNVVLVGQGGVGKTMLAEAMLHLTGRTTRLGGHAGTKPTLDYDGEEGERGFSISTSIAPITWEGTRLNVLDAPCYPDFVGDAYAAMSACALCGKSRLARDMAAAFAEKHRHGALSQKAIKKNARSPFGERAG